MSDNKSPQCTINAATKASNEPNVEHENLQKIFRIDNEDMMGKELNGTVADLDVNKLSCLLQAKLSWTTYFARSSIAQNARFDQLCITLLIR